MIPSLTADANISGGPAARPTDSGGAPRSTHSAPDSAPFAHETDQTAQTADQPLDHRRIVPRHWQVLRPSLCSATALFVLRARARVLSAIETSVLKPTLRT